LRTQFSSGHAAASTLFAGLLWWIAWSLIAPVARLVTLLACRVSCWCLSRMSGLHFPTDIIAVLQNRFVAEL
jgi:membrane-associated phospholipid phosphatase